MKQKRMEWRKEREGVMGRRTSKERRGRVDFELSVEVRGGGRGNSVFDRSEPTANHSA